VAPLLARSFRVLTYDRRAHGLSMQTAGPGSRAQDEADLGALIEVLGLAPGHVVGNSFGASIALGLANSRPDLIASVNAHEPPLVSVIDDDPQMTPLLDDQYGRSRKRRRAAGERLYRPWRTSIRRHRRIRPRGLGHLPAEVQQVITTNALTFVDEMHDPHWADIDL
jgi:pimeloyl-ACP methyl ester carboxylesterase